MESKNSIELDLPNPAFLRIRTPDDEFYKVAEECVLDGSFDTAMKRIRSRMVQAARENDSKAISYYTRAFCAFLRFKGGSYADVPDVAVPAVAAAAPTRPASVPPQPPPQAPRS